MDRKKLLHKMERLGIRGLAKDIFSSYLNDRGQTVNIGCDFSKIKEMDYNVPQGSCLGPLLFLIYINDILDLKLNGKTQLYADDAAITWVVNDLEELYDQINKDLDKITKWFEKFFFLKNTLIVNIEKTNLLIYNSKRGTYTEFPEISTNGQKISRVECVRYLSLLIDSNLNWERQIEKMIKIINPYMAIFRRIAPTCGDDIKRMLYFSFVQSNLTYLMPIWCSTKNENIQKLRILQK